MKMPTALRKQFLLHAKKQSFQQKVISAEARICHLWHRANKPYIAFSGGKDSHVCLALARSVFPDLPAVYFDADCAYPSVTELLENTENLIRFRTQETFLETLGRVGLHHPKIEKITMETTVYEPIARLLETYNFDGCIYGLRAEESAARRAHAKRGATFQYALDSIHRGTYACQPIYDWSYNDVWAYLVNKQIPYCKEYDRLWDLPEREQRISYWAGESNRNFGRFARLKENHPDLFNELQKVCPEIREFV